MTNQFTTAEIVALFPDGVTAVREAPVLVATEVHDKAAATVMASELALQKVATVFQDESGLVITDYDWRARSFCKDPTDFFPPNSLPRENKADRLAREQRAVDVCKRCPVIQECLVSALVNRDCYGVAGSLTPQELKLVIKRLPKKTRQY